MATESVTVDNPYGIGALWAQGDFVAKGVMVLLVIMSAYSWFIIFTKWWEQRRLLSQAHEAEKNFWAADNIKTGLNKLSGKGNIFKGMAAEAIDAAEHHDDAPDAAGPAARVDRQRARPRHGPHQQRAVDAAAVPRHHRFDGAVHRPVRHRVGHLPRARRDRRGRPGFDRQGGGSRRRSPHHDGHRSRGRGAGGARLQLPARPQQADHGARQALLERPRAGDRQRFAHRRRGRQGHLGRRRRSNRAQALNSRWRQNPP